MTKAELINMIKKMRITASDETALESIEAYPVWGAGLAVGVDDRYSHDGKLYRCIQKHVTQNDWTPSVTPALWVVVSLEEWPAWVQPAGAHDAYQTGDKVSHNDKHWVSSADNNIWEPGVYGWNEVE